MDCVPYAAYFPFIHPADADALSLTCKTLQRWVLDDYSREERKAVLSGGVWHHNLCKRARESIAKSQPNHRPLALASLVDNQCIVCQKRLLAKVSFWGFAAHAACIRGFLLNTYYIPGRFGLDANHLRILPQETLTGFSIISGEPYTYKVVFEEPYRRFVPQNWTLEHAVEVYQSRVHDFFEKKRKEAEAQREAEDRKRRRKLSTQKKREAALEKRRRMLENHELASLIHSVHRRMGRRLMGDFLDFLVKPKTSLQNVVDFALKYSNQIST